MSVRMYVCVYTHANHRPYVLSGMYGYVWI